MCLQVWQLALEGNAIGSDAYCLQAWKGIQLPCQVHNVPSEGWLSACQPNFVHASLHKEPGLQQEDQDVSTV